MTTQDDSLASFAARKGVDDLERAVRSEGREPPGSYRDGDRIRLVSDDSRNELTDIRALIENRGLNPDEWVVERVKVNEWESAAKINDEWQTVQLHQLTVWLTGRPQLPEPARIDGPRFTPVKDGPITAASRLVVILPDQQVQAPGEGYDPKLHELVLRWLELNQPDQVVLTGDLCDLPGVSRHRLNPRATNDVNACVTGSYYVLRDYREATPTARMSLIPGNHEKNLQNHIIDKAPALYGLRRGDTTPVVLSLPYLLRLDELGVEWVQAKDGEEWPHSALTLSPHLQARHGWLARSKSGQTALATLEHLGHSVIVGHTHRQGAVFQTKHEIDGRQRVLCAIEAGTLALVEGGLGYSVASNWQNGGVAVRVRPDGTWTHSFLTYTNGALRFEGQTFCMKRGKVVIEA